MIALFNRHEASISKRLMAGIILLELAAALTLVAVVAVHERYVQYQAFDANLRAISHALLGDTQEDVEDRVRLDLSHETLPPQSVFSVTDETGRELGVSGNLPHATFYPDSFTHSEVNGKSYRFFTVSGEREFDPANATGGIRHYVTVTYGLPDGHVRHEVAEAVQFIAACSTVLLGITALLMLTLTRRLFKPLESLTRSADAISPTCWRFTAPVSASRYVELRPLTKALESTVHRLEASFVQQRRFTADAAHELKTDLAIIKSSLQLLSMRERSPSEYEHGIDVTLGDLARLERTVGKMLTLARLEQPVPAAQTPSRFDEVLQVVIRQSEPLAQLKQLTIVTSHSPSVFTPLEKGDAALLCSNILLNAMQHSEPGDIVEVDLQSDSQQVRFSVCDSGEGIQADDAALLFEPFYRSDPSRSRKSGGTGLGLSICKAICERVGGTITIGNRDARGAKVVVRLPRVHT